SLYLEIPFKVEGCTFTNSINKVVASIGTNIDFTDLLSCDDYWNGTSSNVGFELYPPTGVTTPYIKRKFYIQNPITIGSSETLTFTGCDLVFAPGVEITVDDGGELTINLASTIPLHLHTYFLVMRCGRNNCKSRWSI
ncbi:MAG: hypothetical protein IPP71_20580, partial [Bacteroidetes bacterium]|nr:hypothetical protein [Bacteroidota bacterium]